MSRAKILVIDDSPVVLDAARLALTEAGYAVSTLDSALGLGAVIAEERPDLILLDINMPDMHGTKVLELSRRDDFFQDFFQGVPVVLHSDREESDLQHLVGRFGAAGYIRKTTDTKAFLAQLDSLLATARFKKPQM